ncbi:MAG: hypothetical protein Q8L65_13920 [Burkholderiales bacterium]|nr:hypothetical protein [Burkholderiales bacterium]MDP2399327.1 hypothetical protein [Burkholderiales bacterium]
MDPRPVLLAAGDDGPRQTLQPLTHAYGAIVNDSTDAVWADDARWLELILARRPRGLVCGTSDSPEGRAVEAGARRAAARAGIPVAMVEDFPGNYRAESGCGIHLLLVESQSVAAVTRARLGTACPPLHVLSPARYDPYRLQVAARRATLRQAWAGGGKPSVLWAGQPETADCLLTLEALRPVLAVLRLQLLFKAHPRDAGYVAGAYHDLLHDPALSPVDVTALPVEAALLLAPRLVITQFSSLAVEAGFCGIPSLNVLLPGAGADRLFEKKSCTVPPHCLEGAALHTHDPAALTGMIHSAVSDKTLRAGIVRCFDSYFSTGAPTLPAFIEILEDLFANRAFSP